MNHLLSLLNIGTPSSKNKGDFIIALLVILFFGGLLWWLLASGTATNTAANINTLSEKKNTVTTFAHYNVEEKEKANKYETKETNIKKNKALGRETEPVNNNTPEIVLDDIEKGILITAVENVEFKENSAELLRSSRSSLYRVAKIMKKYPDYNLNIVAYTKTSEKEVALARAEVCFNYLIGEEIEPERIQYRGQVYKKVTDTTKKNNDRVEFELSY